MLICRDIRNSMKREALLEHSARSISVIELDHPMRVGIDGVDASGKAASSWRP